ncbi:sugar ABC transporter permease, partial [Bacillus sp. SIMBA_161]
NISNLLDSAGYIAVLAVGMTLIIVIRHIDLSVGFVAGFLGAVAAIFLTQMGLTVWLVIPIVLVFGIIIGLFNGFLVAKIGIPSFVATLAGM